MNIRLYYYAIALYAVNNSKDYLFRLICQLQNSYELNSIICEICQI